MIEDGLLGGHFRLEQNTPNPFNPTTAIHYSLPSAGDAELVIFNVQGRRVRTLVAGPQEAGPGSIIWDGNSDSGTPVSDDLTANELGFNGRVRWVEIDLGDDAEDADHLITPDELLKIAMARQ